MNKPIRRACMVLILMCTVACGSDANRWPEQTGQVLDDATGKGIEGAYVVAYWKGIASYATEVCFHVESHTTDKNGYFRFPSWVNTTKWRVAKDQHVYITVYKEGYIESDNNYGKAQTYKDGKYYLLNVADDNTKNRALFIGKYIQFKNCPESEESEKNLLPFYDAIYSELEKIAKNPQAKLTLITIQRLIDSITLNDEIAWEKWRKAKNGLGL